MANELRFLVLKKDLKFVGLKQDEKDTILKDYKVILKLPKGLKKDYEEVWNYKKFYARCQQLSKNQRQFVYFGKIFKLSPKLYLMVCVLLLTSEIYEEDFNIVDFRPKRCKKTGQKSARNLEKSLADLKTTIRKAFLEDVSSATNYFNNNERHAFDKKLFDEKFKEFAYFEYRYVPCLKSKYQKGVIPTILQRVCKKS